MISFWDSQSAISHFLLILMKNGFDEGSFETAHLPKIGGHLLTLVLIIGLHQFSQIVKLVLRFVKEQTLIKLTLITIIRTLNRSSEHRKSRNLNKIVKYFRVGK